MNSISSFRSSYYWHVVIYSCTQRSHRQERQRLKYISSQLKVEQNPSPQLLPASTPANISYIPSILQLFSSFQPIHSRPTKAITLPSKECSMHMQIPAKKKQKGSSLSSLARYYIVLILKFAPRATKNLPALRDHGSPGRAVMKLAAMLVFVLFFFLRFSTARGTSSVIPLLARG